MRTASAAPTAFNPRGLKVLDKNGRPFTEGCRVRFVLPGHHVNRFSGTGTVAGIDELGGVVIDSDAPIDVRDRNGAVVDRVTRHHAGVGEWHATGPHAGARVTAGTLGDPHEHGAWPVFIEITAD